jgi:hypothetical protein
VGFLLYPLGAAGVAKILMLTVLETEVQPSALVNSTWYAPLLSAVVD